MTIVLVSVGLGWAIAASSVLPMSTDPGQPLAASSVGGPYGERLWAWRTNGLWRVANDPTVPAVYELGLTPALFPADLADPTITNRVILFQVDGGTCK